VSWSGGKDSALTLAALRASPEFEVAALLTNISESDNLVSTHRVPVRLIEAQAKSLGLPLETVLLPVSPSNAIFERRSLEAMQRLASTYDARHMAFGDLFLEDIRDYRVALTQRTEMTPLFPIWGRDTAKLAREFIADGYRARLVAVDEARLPADFVGREFDENLLADLPSGLDPCGERGEFHTFVYDGPIFQTPIDVA
jgi:uncharacterized protein (TIGR00290 family)